MSQVNPGLIYCAVSGYGRDGPDGDKPGFDLIAQGFSGLMSITGEPGGPSVKTGNSIADTNAGILAMAGIAAAYVHKLKTGEGQVVDTSLIEAALQQTYWQAAIYFATGEPPGPTGSAHLLTAPYQAFKASDGWINIGGANQGNWERIAVALGCPAWCEDPRFKTKFAAHRKPRSAGIDDERDRGKAHQGRVDRHSRRSGRTRGPVHTIGEALTHPQTLTPGMVVDLVHPQAGATKALGCPIHFSKTATRIDRARTATRRHFSVAISLTGLEALHTVTGLIKRKQS